jgi:hypothetical protein
MNCMHGLDERFCATCNRTTRSISHGVTGRVSLEAVLAFLNDEQLRATYGAVADVVGVSPRAISAQLGPRRPEASWIVSAENGLPTGYDQAEWHPALLDRGEIITSGRTLLLRMTLHRSKNPTI